MNFFYYKPIFVKPVFHNIRIQGIYSQCLISHNLTQGGAVRYHFTSTKTYLSNNKEITYTYLIELTNIIIVVTNRSEYCFKENFTFHTKFLDVNKYPQHFRTYISGIFENCSNMRYQRSEKKNLPYNGAWQIKIINAQFFRQGCKTVGRTGALELIRPGVTDPWMLNVRVG